MINALSKISNISTVSAAEFNKLLIDAKVSYCLIKTAAGDMLLSFINDYLFAAKFLEDHEILDYKSYEYKNLNINNLKFLLVGTDFQIKVWQASLKIEFGQTSHYEKLAEELNMPRAYRAVANALGNNKIAYFIPCHRVLRKDGSLGGYRYGLHRKQALLNSEQGK